MALSLRKAEFDLNSFGKHLDESDPTLANHVALLLTILSGKRNAPSLAMFQNKELEKKRMTELDEIYARGGRPPLAEKFSNIKHNNGGNYARARAVKITNKNTGETLEFKSIKQAAKYLNKVCPDRTVSSFENRLQLKTGYREYTFEVQAKHDERISNRKKDKRSHVIIENLETGEVLEFENVNKCVHYLKTVCEGKIYPEKIKIFSEKGKVFEGWKIRYKEVQDAK